MLQDLIWEVKIGSCNGIVPLKTQNYYLNQSCPKSFTTYDMTRPENLTP